MLPDTGGGRDHGLPGEHGISEGIGGDGIAGDIARGAMASVGGGLAAVAGGGKFEDGATTAAFGYLFNEMLTTKDGRKFKSPGKYYNGDTTISGMGDPSYNLHPGDPINNAEIGLGVSSGILMGASSTYSYAVDGVNGPQCQATHCFLVGPFAGYSVNPTLSVGIGSVPANDALSVALFGSFVPVVGGHAQVSGSSGGVSVSGALAKGAMFGGGIGLCQTNVVNCR